MFQRDKSKPFNTSLWKNENLLRAVLKLILIVISVGFCILAWKCKKKLSKSFSVVPLNGIYVSPYWKSSYKVHIQKALQNRQKGAVFFSHIGKTIVCLDWKQFSKSSQIANFPGTHLLFFGGQSSFPWFPYNFGSATYFKTSLRQQLRK